MKNGIHLIVTAGLALGGCAGKIIGSVTPFEGGQYQAVSVAGEKDDALRIANKDAKLTCKREGSDRYEVISQDVQVDGPEIDTGSKVTDTLVGLSKIGRMVRDNNEYEVTLTFKCTS